VWLPAPITKSPSKPCEPSALFYIATSDRLCRLYENEAGFISNFYAVMSRFGSAKNKAGPP
jgi:hypothetical protein